MPKSSECPCLGGTLDKLIQPAILASLSHGPLHGYKLAERISEMASCSAGKPTIYIELIVDGEIVDLNRIPLPADTPIIDERFKHSTKKW